MNGLVGTYHTVVIIVLQLRSLKEFDISLKIYFVKTSEIGTESGIFKKNSLKPIGNHVKVRVKNK